MKRFIFASSTAVYDHRASFPLDETSPLVPTTSYGISKLAAEVYCENYANTSEMDIIIFRLSNVYGPRQHRGREGGVISNFIHQAVNDKPIEIYGDGQQTRDFIYINDVVYAMYAATTSIVSGTYNLTYGVDYTINEVAQFVAEQMVDSEIEYISEQMSGNTKGAYNNEKTKRNFDWVPFYTLQQGVEKTIQWTAKQIEKTEKAHSTA